MNQPEWLEQHRPANTDTHKLFTPIEEVRRRLLLLGAKSLSDTELVALTLEQEHAVERATRLLDAGLRGLLDETPEVLLEYRHLSHDEVTRLLAMVELARRFDATPLERVRLTSPASIYDLARKQFLGLRREEFHVLCLDAKNVVLRQVRIAEGAVDQITVDPREVLAPIIATRATGVVLLHNHPSGDPEPSVHDVTLTRRISEACRLLCVRLVDHVVFGEKKFVSMLARGLISHAESTYSSRG